MKRLVLVSLSLIAICSVLAIAMTQNPSNFHTVFETLTEKTTLPTLDITLQLSVCGGPNPRGPGSGGGQGPGFGGP